MNRREFLKGSVGFGVFVSLSPRVSAAPGDKLNVAVVGVEGRGAGNLAGVAGQNVVALCDVDEARLGRAAAKFPKARTYVDWRKLLDDAKDVDAVVVSTPDHLHAPIALGAMNLGKHVYCEKPLAHTVHEARLMAETAARQRVVTQMGNQLHSTEHVIRPVEIFRSGALGTVTEVHVWSDKVFAPGDRPKETPPVPPGLHWDLWLGPAPERPFHKAYVPFHWRGWWDFGGGNLADMACHLMDPAVWALQLGSPLTVEAEGPPAHPESSPAWRIVRYTFPGVRLTWYDGGKRPPAELSEGEKLASQGSLWVGDKGKMILAHGGGHKLLPESKFKDFRLPEPTIPRPAGHHEDWLQAIRAGKAAGSSFGYGGPLTEIPLLGNVAYRAGAKVEWDAAALKARHLPEADRYIRKEYRKGWELPA
jgi:predicted dehydrogenase